MRVAIHTLGCKVNQYESQAMEELLRARGHSLVPFEAQADVYLINSCTVTATSDKKSRQAVRQARKRAPGALVALCGCYPQVSPEAARQLEADLIGGSGDRRGFLDLLEQLARTREKAVALDDPFRRRVFEALRWFDGTGVSHIWAQCPAAAGIGLAVANRLNKAAGFHIVRAE